MFCSMQSSKARLLARTRWIKPLIVMLSESKSLQKIAKSSYYFQILLLLISTDYHPLVESHLFPSLTCSWVAPSAPSLVPLLQLKASLQRAPHKSLQPLLNATQRSYLVSQHLTTILTVSDLCTLIEKGHMKALHKQRVKLIPIPIVVSVRTLHALTLSSSSCCLLFSSTAALRSSSFCLCSSSLRQRSSTVRSYCSRALRSFSLISCSRAARRSVSTLSHDAVQCCWCCFFLFADTRRGKYCFFK